MLYDHRTYKRYLKDSAPTDEELSAFIEEAESIALNLLIKDDES